MQISNRVSRISQRSLAAALGTALALAAAAPARAQTVDDLFLFTSSYPPNVMILQDNSVSMNHIEWHPAYDNNATPTCDYYNNNLDYIVTSQGARTLGAAQTANTACWRTRTIYDPADAPEDTRYSGRYLNWLFSAESNA